MMMNIQLPGSQQHQDGELLALLIYQASAAEKKLVLFYIFFPFLFFLFTILEQV